MKTIKIECINNAEDMHDALLHVLSAAVFGMEKAGCLNSHFNMVSDLTRIIYFKLKE